MRFRLRRRATGGGRAYPGRGQAIIGSSHAIGPDGPGAGRGAPCANIGEALARLCAAVGPAALNKGPAKPSEEARRRAGTQGAAGAAVSTLVRTCIGVGSGPSTCITIARSAREPRTFLAPALLSEGLITANASPSVGATPPCRGLSFFGGLIGPPVISRGGCRAESPGVALRTVCVGRMGAA